MADMCLLWLRNDLRIQDNPALAKALEGKGTVHALYVEETDPDLRPMGAAARAWLYESLELLAVSLAELGVKLHVEQGKSASIVPEMVREHGARTVVWNRRYAPAEREHDGAIKDALREQGVAVSSFNAALLAEPWTIATKSGTPFAVFTPFWNALKATEIAPPGRKPRARASIAPPRLDTPAPAEWGKKILAHWSVGEDAARERLGEFLDDTVAHYAEGRDVPSVDFTSRLSPHLKFGEIGPRQIWAAASHLAESQPELSGAAYKFLSEVAWREFSYNLLYHRDDIANVPMQERFTEVSWRKDSKAFDAWRKGQTGIPIVDAGMRQLWETGWMHNRVRMLTASLLSKNLLVDWRQGEQWFWDTLVDADTANNPASWQWVAGCGADAAPYFRIFNPVTQSRKFDADANYIRQYVPEIANLPDKLIHAPWEADKDSLKAAGISLGTTYPHPIVDLKSSRERALDALARS